jgi:oxygen-dependent protoporphyrinogen oxidase
VQRLTTEGSRYRLEGAKETLMADAVILATPAGSSAALLESIDSPVAGHLADIRYAPSATVSLGYRLQDLSAAPEGHGYIIPRREGRLLLAVTWTSNKFAGRAPENYVLVRGFFGRPEHADVLQADDAELVRLLGEELRATAGITAEPVLSSVTRWPSAMPQYAIGHLDRLAEIERRLTRHPGLVLAGAAYHGVGLPDCIQSGEDAARKILALVSAAPR